METNQVNPGSFAWKFGLILGAISIVFALMLYFVDAHTTRSPVVQVVNVVIAAAVIFWALMQFRKANGGLLSIPQSLKIGAGIGVIAGIISVLFTIFLANVLDPDYISTMIDAQMAENAANMTPEQLEQGREMGKSFFWISYPIIIIVSTLFGLIIGLVGGLIFKKSD